MKEPDAVEWVVPPTDERLDRFLAAQDLALSRSQAQRLIRDGHVTVDGRQVPARHRLKGGEQLRVRVPPPVSSETQPEAIPLDRIHEDRWLVVVDKHRGMVVHPAPGHATGTLVNALLHGCPDLSGVGGVLRPGIVHRLDKDTSGLLIVAKDDETHRALQMQFQHHEVEKVYLAVVVGRLEGEGRIDLPVGRHPKDRKKMAVDAPRGRVARTRWQSVAVVGGVSLLSVRIETGRTHQIRVHLAHLGHPVVGDPLYGGIVRGRGVQDPRVRRRLSRETTQALHAWRLAFVHPRTGDPLRLEAPLPEPFRALIEDLFPGVELPPTRP